MLVAAWLPGPPFQVLPSPWCSYHGDRLAYEGPPGPGEPETFTSLLAQPSSHRHPTISFFCFLPAAHNHQSRMNIQGQIGRTPNSPFRLQRPSEGRDGVLVRQ